MDVRAATRGYETWLGRTLPVLHADLDRKHRFMGGDPFSFLRATFYRWAQLWPGECPELADAPEVLAVGDLHVENFGTWRDAEGRLIWGINDFDETVQLPYTQDLVRLGTSALLAIEESRLQLSARRACAAILEGYAEAMSKGGGCVVLAERYRWLRDLAVARAIEARRRDHDQGSAPILATPALAAHSAGTCSRAYPATAAAFPPGGRDRCTVRASTSRAREPRPPAARGARALARSHGRARIEAARALGLAVGAWSSHARDTLRRDHRSGTARARPLPDSAR